MTKTGTDSVASSAAEWRSLVNFPVDVVGSYSNGRFANTAAAKEALPNKIHVQYDVNGSLPAMDILDIEPQDAVPADGPGWVKRHNQTSGSHVLIAAGLYCSASTVNEVEHDMTAASARMAKLVAHVSDLLDAGFKRGIDFLVQSAHYGAGRHICAPAVCGFPEVDSTQHADKGPAGQNVDLVLYEDYCFGVVKPPPFNPHYDLFDDVKRIIGATEEGTVREYDRWRALQTKTEHPHRLRLFVLRVRLRWFASRLARVLKTEKHPLPHQKWRLRELRYRQAGMRIV